MSNEERKVFYKVKAALLAIHPQFLMWHHTKFEAPLPPADEFVGGFSASMHFKAIVGWVRFYVQPDDNFTIIFGAFPKDVSGKNVWKEHYRLTNISEANLKTVLESLDSDEHPQIPGAITSKQAKTRNLKRLKK